MCLYTKKILNRHYMPTKKNDFNPPMCTDERLRYVEVPCGHCYECRRKKARDWGIRMQEELKQNREAIFFTGTFTDERIEHLSNKYNIEKENVNLIATKEVRLFLERIRPNNKGKSIRHWIVTEKGHTNTRRIHIHGIFWGNNRRDLSLILKKCWTAGYSYQGTYVSAKTINYIVKYMTKTDLDNPDFTGIVLASPGLGAKFVESYNAKRCKYVVPDGFKKTIETYKYRDGREAYLPKYYRDKIYTEEQRELLWIQKMEEGCSFVMGEKIDTSTDEGQKMYDKLKVEFYRPLCIRVHKDDPELWERQKAFRRHEREANYAARERIEREKYYNKLERGVRRADRRLKQDIEMYSNVLGYSAVSPSGLIF